MLQQISIDSRYAAPAAVDRAQQQTSCTPSLLSIDGTDRQTDGRTPDRFIDPSPHAISKTCKDVKFTVYGGTSQTLITLSTKNFCLLLAVHLRLDTYGPSVSGSTQCKEIAEIV